MGCFLLYPFFLEEGVLPEVSLVPGFLAELFFQSIFIYLLLIARDEEKMERVR